MVRTNPTIAHEVGIRRYRKRPLEIEAAFFDGSAEQAKAICAWMSMYGTSCIWGMREDGQHTIGIDTPEGQMLAEPRTYVCRGIESEFYPCQQSIFEATYDDVIGPIEPEHVALP